MDNFGSDVMEYIQNTIRGTEFSSRPWENNTIMLENSATNFKCLLVLKPIIYDSFSSQMTLEEIDGFGDYKIMYLWEDLWKFHRPKIESKLRSVLGLSQRLHGRDSIVKPITNNDLLLFLTENHLHIPIKARYKFGLFYDKQMMAVMSYSKGRPIKRNGQTFQSFELLRFCNKLNHTVVGGFSKLLRHFIRTIHPDDIMTYVDKDWSDGLTYKKAGFECVQTLEPMEFLLNSDTGERIYPHRAQLHKRQGEEASFVEKEAHKMNFARVYNSGSYKYILFIKK